MTFKPDLTHLDTLIVTVSLSPESLTKVKKNFKTVHYYPDPNTPVPDEALAKADIWYSNWQAFPAVVKKAEQVPELKVMQLSSAGANSALANPLFKDSQIRKQVALCTASGIHAFSIPQYVIAQTVNLYTFFHIQSGFIRGEERWPSREELAKAAHPGEDRAPTSLGSRSLYGKTAGLLGYGHIGREVARLLKAYNVNIIAANSSGEKKKDDGYIVPGTGDEDGSIPSAYYSTNDPSSFKEFLSKSDIVVASLPSTSATKWLLTAELLKSFKDRSVFLNVGRGDLVHSDDLLAALDSPSGLYAAALDVTDPEPLPAKHPLLTHPHVIVTPHTSGDFEGYYDAGADLLIANAERMRSGGKAMNLVDLERGY